MDINPKDRQDGLAERLNDGEEEARRLAWEGLKDGQERLELRRNP
jgi:hypothetical protein